MINIVAVLSMPFFFIGMVAFLILNALVAGFRTAREWMGGEEQ